MRRRRDCLAAARAALLIALLAAPCTAAWAETTVVRERICDRPSVALQRDGLVTMTYEREDDPAVGSVGAITVENDGSHPLHVAAPIVALARTLVLPGERRRIPVASAPPACVDAVVEFWINRAPVPVDLGPGAPGRGMWQGGSSRPSSSAR